MIARKIFLITLAFGFAKLSESFSEVPVKAQERKLEEEEQGAGLVDVRSALSEREADNPLSELWDTNHLKVAKQKVNLNMNMPLNRLKLKLDRTYQVKIVVENDEDFDKLYDYFYPKENKQEEKPNDSEETHGLLKKAVKK